MHSRGPASLHGFMYYFTSDAECVGDNVGHKTYYKNNLSNPLDIYIVRFARYVGHNLTFNCVKPGSHVTKFSPTFSPIKNRLHVFLWCCPRMTKLQSVNTHLLACNRF